MSKITKPGELKTLFDVYSNYFSSCQYLDAGDAVGEFNEKELCLQINTKLSKEGEKGYPIRTILKNWHINIFIHLRLIGQYFEGEFKPESKDKDFLLQILSIWPDFIPAWYFGTVYIGYGDDLLEIEKEYIRKNNPDYPDEQAKLWCKFRLYRKQQKKGKEGKDLYSSVLTGTEGIAIDSSRLVVCSCARYINWICWFDLLKEYLAGQQKFISSFNASIKRVVSLVGNWAAFAKEIEQLDDDTVILTKNIAQTQGINNNIYKPFEFMPLNAPETILKTNQAYFELKASLLGLAGKALNNKAERMNVVETEQNLSLISNMRARNLRNLQLIALRMKEVFGDAIPEDFEIKISESVEFPTMPNPPNAATASPQTPQDTIPVENGGQVKY